MTEEVVAHDQVVVNRYTIHFPEHEPRKDDPHYLAFEAYRRAHVHEAVCYVGKRIGLDACDGGIELHHHFLEFAVANEVDLQAIEVDYPNLTDPEKVAEWAESEPNFMWLCAKHHRGVGGVHHAAASDFEAEIYVKNLIK